jgi:phosphate/sulfate permease
LLPFIAGIVKGALSKDGFSFTELFESGELFLVSAVVAFGVAGELITSALSDGKRLWSIVLSSWVLLALVSDAMAYMVVLLVQSTPPSKAMYVSLIMFGLTLLISGVSMRMAVAR